MSGSTPLDSHQHGQAKNLIDEAQLRQEPTDRDIGANIESRDSKGVLQRNPGEGPNGSITSKSEARTSQGFKVGDEGDQHDLAASKQP
ncbi:hypothetical protein VM1G_02956 [Cytospora mali]|uniref:Uncharacterized protein n=1 Tax=Cytospora mali TaxID=578113 RepID=A0A194VUZ2_CYTMA|nr:hypothetical protein VM1G_02956 [Valsa mali]